MKISTQDGATRRWTKPVEVGEIVWFIGKDWGYAYDKAGGIISGAISKLDASGKQTRDWLRVTETNIVPPMREVEASTGG